MPPHRQRLFLRHTLWLAVLLVLASLPPASLGDTPPTPGPADAREEGFEAPAGETPPGWRLVTFRRRTPTQYAVERSAGRTSLRGEADGSAASLVWEAEFDPRTLSHLEWEWKISGTLPGADLTRRATEDLPARLMVLFPFDEERAAWWERIAHELARMRYGEEPPGEALVYAWGNRTPVEAWNASTYTDRVQILCVESGDDRAGQWVRAMRDIAVDYRARFGRPPPRRARLAVMVDTDDTHTRTVTWFDSIRLRPAAPPSTAGADQAPATAGG